MPPSPYDHRNLTDWLLRELRANASSPEVAAIAEYNNIASDLLEVPFGVAFYPLFKGLAYDDWIALVRDGAR